MSQKQIIAAAIRTARAQGGKVHDGPIHSSVAGRTDHLPMHVASGSYVIPADIISAMGEGNSMAGFKVAKNIFGGGDVSKGAEGLPKGMLAPNKKASGGTISTGNATADKAIAEGNERVIRNQDAAANYAAMDNARDGSAIPAHLQQRLDNRPSSGGSDDKAVKGKGLLGGVGNILRGQIGGFKNYGDMINGGGKYGSYANPYSGGTTQAKEPKKGTWLNRNADLIGAGLGLVSGAGLLTGAGAGKLFRKNDEGVSRLDILKNDILGKAAGGATGGIPIVAAGGEYVIPPHDVLRIGNGDLDNGHKILDSFVKKMRQKTIKTLQRLPGPKKD